MGFITKVIKGLKRKTASKLAEYSPAQSPQAKSIPEKTVKSEKVVRNSPFTIDVNKSLRFEQLEQVIASSVSCDIPEFSSPELDGLKQDFRKGLPELGYLKLTNVYVFGSGFLMTEDRKRITSSYLPYTNVNTEKGIKLSSGSVRQLEDGNWRTRPLNIIDVEEPALLLTQPGDTIFGHWLVDLIPMFALFKESGIKARPIIKRSVLAGKAIPDINGIFDLLGFDKADVLGLTENLEAYFCKELYVPTVVRYGQQVHSYTGKLLEPYRLTPSKISVAKKIYFSRRLWTAPVAIRVLRNALDVEKYYAENGFEIIYPEQLSFKQKLELISNAEEVVGEKGTALHLTAFSKTIKKVTVLVNPVENMTGLPLLQGELCKLQGVECRYIIGNVVEDGEGFIIPVPNVLNQSKGTDA